MGSIAWFMAGLAVASLGFVCVWALRRGGRRWGTPDQRATVRVLDTAETVSRAFDGRFDAEAAEAAVDAMRAMIGAAMVVVFDRDKALAAAGDDSTHSVMLAASARHVAESDRAVVVKGEQARCGTTGCTVGEIVLVPVHIDGSAVGALAAGAGSITPALVRTTEALADWIARQVQVAEARESKSRLAEAEVRFLRAQISPHFIYNALGAIASFVRSDPDRARELLLDFADFTRYSFARRGQFTTLADELLAVERYLRLEQARFGERLNVTLRVAPEVLGTAVPFLVMQPIVENAVRHGIEGKEGPGHITITADDRGPDCRIAIDDDGIGMDPDWLRRQFAEENVGDRVGLANVDERLRSLFGPSYGLAVETGIGAGTKVIFRVPKYVAGVRAS